MLRGLTAQTAAHSAWAAACLPPRAGCTCSAAKHAPPVPCAPAAARRPRARTPQSGSRGYSTWMGRETLVLVCVAVVGALSGGGWVERAPRPRTSEVSHSNFTSRIFEITFDSQPAPRGGERSEPTPSHRRAAVAPAPSPRWRRPAAPLRSQPTQSAKGLACKRPKLPYFCIISRLAFQCITGRRFYSVQ